MKIVVNLQSLVLNLPDALVQKAINTGDFTNINAPLLTMIKAKLSPNGNGEGLVESVEEL